MPGIDPLTGRLTRPRVLRLAVASVPFMATLWSTQAAAQTTASSSPVGGAQTTARPLDPTSRETSTTSPQADTPSSDIIVTGTQIRGVASTGSDTVAISSAEILASGSSTASEMLKRIPQVTTFGADESNRSTNQGGNANRTYGTAVNLRGLGPSSTLTLVNGHRVPTSGLQGQYVDPSIIPNLVIERLEVVPDGASAIYGSDAVAGVANVITRRSFDGVQATGRVGLADGYRDYQGGILAGKRFDRGNVLIAYEYTGHTDLEGRDRSFFTADLRPFGGADNRATLSVPGNIVANGISYALPAGNGRVTTGQLVAGTTNRLDQYAGQDILPTQDRHSVFSSGRYDLTEHLALDYDGYWSRRSYAITDPTPTATLTVPNTNPFFVSPAAGATSVNVQYSFLNDIGNARTTGFSKSYGGHFGLTQDLFADWRLNAQANVGRDDEQYLANTVVRTIPLATALADRNAATALNPFGSGGLTNAGTVSSLIGFADTRASFVLHQYLAKADGGLFDLPGGTVRVAVGGEYRREKLSNSLFTNRTTADPVTASASTARRTVKAAFAEVAVPVIGDANGFGGVRRLDLSLALRHERYSDFGSTTNPKVGLNWTPVDGLKLRGTFGKSFRAPTLSDIDPLSSGGGLFPLNNIVDPTSSTGRSNGLSIAGGNPDLDPEKATTFTAGFDLDPPAIAGLHASGTFYSIKDSNLIGFLQGSTTFLIQEALYGQFITRNPSAAQVQAVLASGLPVQGVINPSQVRFILDGRRQNFGETRMQGIDFSLDYTLATRAGAFSAGVFGTYLTRLKNKAATTAPFRDVRGDINWPSTFRARGNLGWKDGPYSLQSFINYVNAYDNNLVTPIQRVSSYTTVDLALVMDLSGTTDGILGGTTLALTAQNVFDRQPPFVNNPAGYGWDPQVAGSIGRLVSLTVTRKF